MKTILKIIYEAMAQALQQLRGNKLRSFLSLLGISIGIFCIIGVLAAVDSLEDNVRSSLDKLGSDIVYVNKWPWADNSNNWWNLIKRPQPHHSDYKALKVRSNYADLVSYHVFIGSRTIKFKSNSVERTALLGTSMEFVEMFKLDFYKGRYFSLSEYNYGSNKIILGYSVAEELFGTIDPMGKKIKLSGKEYEVIGVIAKSGEDLLNPLNFDEAILVSYPSARGLANLNSNRTFEGIITAKAIKGVGMQNLKDEIRGVLRAHRRINPKEKDNFALNEVSLVSTFFDSFFNVLNLLGIVIGAFAMLVGGVSVANIMFVSVKERTNLIGIKKALGAKNYFILLEFLVEAIILCLFGGIIGLLLVHITVTILSGVIDFDLYLDLGNIIVGVVCSIIVGVAAGVIPAMRAARMDPVDAMRQ